MRRPATAWRSWTCTIALPSRPIFFNNTPTTAIYTLSLPDALPISGPVGQIDHTNGRGHAAWRRVQDRHGQKRVTAIAPLDRVGRLRGTLVARVIADRAHLSKHARRDRHRIIHFNRIHLELDAARGHESQHVRARVMDQ